VLEEQADEIKSGGGITQLLRIASESSEQEQSLRGLFDRTADYGQIVKRLEALKREAARLRESEARQKLATLRRDLASVSLRDFFPGEPRQQAESALETTEDALNRRFSPDEPRTSHQRLKHRQRTSYRGRMWATRERLWIDRVASAWLIRRFIDPKAKFLWLKRVKDCPKGAVGFDFDGAEFTHVNSRVTFEVLLASFNLEHDAGLSRLGALVHYLDVGGIPVAEAAGFTSIMAGARELQPDDNALLKTMTPVLDNLYAAYARPRES
jgi:hypothetical protein